MITVITNYDLSTIEQSFKTLLEKSSNDEVIRSIAITATLGKPDNISAIYDFMRRNSVYVSDPVDKEMITSPSKFALDYYVYGKPITGDCDDLALFTTALYRSIGIESNIVLIDTKNQGFSHAYSVAKSPSVTWISVDLASRFPLGWEPTYYQKVVIE